MEALHAISSVLSFCWLFFTETIVPGIGISFAGWYLTLLLVSISIGLISYVFGFGGSGTGYRSGQSRNKHISENRKGDEK